MAVFRFKACPKCGGDLYEDHEAAEGWCEQCIQCGLRKYVDVIADTREFPRRREMHRHLKEHNIEMKDATDMHWSRGAAKAAKP